MTPHPVPQRAAALWLFAACLLATTPGCKSGGDGLLGGLKLPKLTFPTFANKDSTDPSDSVKAAGEAFAQEEAAEVGAAVISLADKRLLDIAEREEDFFARVARVDDPASNNRLQLRAQRLVGDYEVFLDDNPDSLYGRILFGKFLRKVGQTAYAHEQFLQADAINPEVAVVKQQLANFFAEEGLFPQALANALAAIKLDPGVARYHYALGEMLATYRDSLVAGEVFEPNALDRQLRQAFGEAVRLAPDQRILRIRLAETVYDVGTPDWQQALHRWDALLVDAASPNEREVLTLHRARALAELGRNTEAMAALEQVESPALAASKRTVLDILDSRQP